MLMQDGACGQTAAARGDALSYTSAFSDLERAEDYWYLHLQAKATIEDTLKDWDANKDANVAVSAAFMCYRLGRIMACLILPIST